MSEIPRRVIRLIYNRRRLSFPAPRSPAWFPPLLWRCDCDLILARRRRKSTRRGFCWCRAPLIFTSCEPSGGEHDRGGVQDPLNMISKGRHVRRGRERHARIEIWRRPWLWLPFARRSSLTGSLPPRQALVQTTINAAGLSPWRWFQQSVLYLAAVP